MEQHRKATIIVNDEVWAQVKGLASEDHLFLWNYFAIEVEGSFYNPKRRLGLWDGKIRFYDKSGKIFLRKIETLVTLLEKWRYTIELQDNRRLVPACTTRATPGMFRPAGLSFDLRDYQIQAINTALDTGSGILLMGTGAGKTLVCAALCQCYGTNGLRCIVIVPSSDLVEQTSATLRLAGVDHGVYSGAKKDLSHPHVIATWQSLQHNMEIMKDFQVLIGDECHEASAKTIGELITNHGRHIAYRFGMTGTMPKGKTEVFTLEGSLGNVIFEISCAELIKRGYLSDLEIQPVEIQELVEENFPDYPAEKLYVGKQPARLDFIADLIIDGANKYGNTLVLVNNIKQGQQLQKLIKDSVFLYGNTENEVRAEWYSMFQEKDDLIVIATIGIARQGLSIDRIFHLMFIDVGKSFTRAIQSVGRGLRKAHDKNFVHISDVYSSLKFGKKHFALRKKYYKDAQYKVLTTIKANL